MVLTMEKMDRGTNPLTVLVESAITEVESDYLILQYKGEAVSNPVLPASKSSGTIVYTVVPEDDETSTMDLLATSEPITTSVSGRYFQTASSMTPKEKDCMMAANKMWVLGRIELKLPRKADLPKSQLLVQVVHTIINQGHKTAHVEALLLAQRDTEAHADPDAWKSWGFTESTSLDEIVRRSEAGGKYRLESRMPKTIFSLDVYNTAKDAEFEY
jgi:hypothetical protein